MSVRAARIAAAVLLSTTAVTSCVPSTAPDGPVAQAARRVNAALCRFAVRCARIDPSEEAACEAQAQEAGFEQGPSLGFDPALFPGFAAGRHGGYDLDEAASSGRLRFDSDVVAGCVAAIDASDCLSPAVAVA